MTAAEQHPVSGLSQRAIYDERYRVGKYDERSAVRVLTAEAEALEAAVGRALRRNPDADELSLFDFGYGTGRVTNEFVDDYAKSFGHTGKGLRVIAYDVSSVGLEKAARALLARPSFYASQPLTWLPDSAEGYVAGEVRGVVDDAAVTVVFVHASETEPLACIPRLVRAANRDRPSLVTTSWYSGIGHMPRRAQRELLFDALDRATDPDGELLVAVSSTGDLVEEQRLWEQRLSRGEARGYPVEGPGDAMYETELGTLNFYHVFGVDLAEHLSQVCRQGQRWWVEGIRLPDEEFASKEEEHRNYREVMRINDQLRGKAWTAEDYSRFHTVVAIRSSAPSGPA